jgi:hypothetical protein
MISNKGTFRFYITRPKLILTTEKDFPNAPEVTAAQTSNKKRKKMCMQIKVLFCVAKETQCIATILSKSSFRTKHIVESDSNYD